jgi:hypothetical protein
MTFQRGCDRDGVNHAKGKHLETIQDIPRNINLTAREIFSAVFIKQFETFMSRKTNFNSFSTSKN